MHVTGVVENERMKMEKSKRKLAEIKLIHIYVYSHVWWG